MALEQETAYFDAHREELLADHAGEFALIHEDRLIGTFPDFGAAYSAGIQTVGNLPFLIKQLVEVEATAQFPALSVGMLSARP